MNLCSLSKHRLFIIAMAILCPNTVSLSYSSSSFPLREAYHLRPRSSSSSLSCPAYITNKIPIPWWKNTSIPADCRKSIGRGFLSQGFRARDSKKRPSVSGFEDQDAKVSEASVYEELEQKISNRLAGISGRLMAEMSCEKEKEAQELYNLEVETIADDKGRSPRDYYRRAHLFDRTAQIFTSPVHKDDNDQEDAHQ